MLAFEPDTRFLIEVGKQCESLLECSGSIYGVREQASHVGDYLGCGTFFRNGADVLMLTAMHVARESDKYHHALHDRRDRKSCPFRNVWIGDPNPEVDLAMWGCFSELTDSTSIAPLPESAFDGRSFEARQEFFYCDGVPAKDTTLVSVMRAFQTVSNPILTRGVPVGEPFDPSIHFAISYPRDVNPAGMSGSAVWNTNIHRLSKPEDWSPKQVSLAGVVQRWVPERKYLIVTRVEYAKRFVLSAIDHLREMWRKAPGSDYTG